MKSWEDWQKPYQFGILVIWPPNELREIFSSQRERIDPISGSYCEAHITVTQPLCRHLDIEEWNELEVILSSFDTFEISYGPLQTFFPYPCIWYEIQPAEKILEIRDLLHQTNYFNLDMDHPKNFIPHMTITEGLSGPKVDDKLFHMLQQESGKGSFQCLGLSCIIPDKDFKFQVKSFLPFS
jgi:2'-5' RNA ligase